MTFTIYHFLLYFAFLLSIDYSFVRKIFTWQYYLCTFSDFSKDNCNSGGGGLKKNNLRLAQSGSIFVPTT